MISNDPYYVERERARQKKLERIMEEARNKKREEEIVIPDVNLRPQEDFEPVEKTWTDEELTVVCWKWTQPGYRSKFTAKHVHTLQSMVERHLQTPHRFVCITDNRRGLKCESIKLWNEPEIQLPPEKPNCYRRLKAFEESAKDWLGKRIVSIDLDVVITGDITELVNRPYDFMIWGDTAVNTLYNGGFWVMNAGTRARVWNDFTSDAPAITARQRIIGSDQAWISHVLGAGEYTFGVKDGLYSYRNHLRKTPKQLPENAKIVFFHGLEDPWEKRTQDKSPWILDHYY